METIHLIGQYCLDSLPVLGKIMLAGLLGGIIGYEREAHGQAAGFRTNIMVALGSCLMMMLSLHMEEMFRHLTDSTVVRLDPGRIASYAISGVGFLGAGAIIKGKGTVRGLTTAASLWAVTAIGLAVGAGYILPAILTTLVAMLILYNFRRILSPIIVHDLHTILTIACCCPRGILKDIRKILSQYESIQIQAVNYYQELPECLTYRIRILSKDDIPRGKITGELLALPGLKKMSWEEADVP